MKRLVFVPCLVCTLLISSAAHAATVRTVALSGQQAPGTPSGVNFTGYFSYPVLNDAGQTAFIAGLPGSAVDGAYNHGIWSEGSGSLALVARNGSQAPGTPSGVNFSRFVLGYWSTILLNDAGQTAFGVTLTGSGVVAGTNDTGIWSEGSGSMALVARSGDHAPGNPSDVTFSNHNFGGLVLNNTGRAAFRAGIRGGDGVFIGDRFFSSSPGSLALVYPAGSSPVLNNAGQIAAAHGGSVVRYVNDSGIWSGSSVVRAGDPAPGTPSGVNYSGFGAPALNDAGQTAFFASLSGSGVGTTNNGGIWSEGPGTLALVAREGSQAPGTPSGVNYSGFGVPALNDAGQTAFFASLSGSGVVGGTNNAGIWSEGSGNLALVARSGDHAPGTPSGVNFNQFLSPLVLNEAGQVAMWARVTDSFGLRDGIWATDRNGDLQLIARQGDLLEVAPGDFRTISYLAFESRDSTGNSDGRPSYFNNLGQLAFIASFTDGTGGIFVSNRVAIPEPSALALVAAGLGVFVLRRRRNANNDSINDARFNRLVRNNIVLAIAVIAAFQQAPTAAHAATVRMVALSGQPAPGMPDGVVFGGSLLGTQLALNDTGQTAFRAFHTGGGDAGIWSEGSGSLALLDGDGEHVYGLVLNDAGQTALHQTSGINPGIWSEGSGTLGLVARAYEHAPGTPSGVNFSDFEPPKLNNAGQTAFAARLSGSGVDSSNDYGFWSEGSGSVALVAREGDQAPGMPSGANYGEFFTQSLVAPVLNDAGQIAFTAGVVIGTGNYQGIWSERSDSLALVARTASQAPGAPEGVNFASFRTGGFNILALNDVGQTAFAAILFGSGVDSTNNRGIWSEGSGSLALVARSGDHAPGTPSGVTFRDPSSSTRTFSNPVLNDAGQTAFIAGIADSAGVSIGNGIWLERSGSLTLVARNGDHAPGAAEGVNFARVDSTYLQLNDAGQIAFAAGLTENGVGVGEGRWATDRTGELQLIARTGDLLEVAPGEFRTIASFLECAPCDISTPWTGNSDGRRSVFNNRGQLAFAASFTDGSSGIFVSNRVAVPEPSTFALVAAGVLGLVGCAPRRRDRKLKNHFRNFQILWSNKTHRSHAEHLSPLIPANSDQ